MDGLKAFKVACRHEVLRKIIGATKTFTRRFDLSQNVNTFAPVCANYKSNANSKAKINDGAISNFSTFVGKK